MKRTFKANPIATTNTLERTPTTDTLVKPSQNKTKKTLLTIGAIVLAGVGIFTAIKAGKAHQQKKAIQEIEKLGITGKKEILPLEQYLKEEWLTDNFIKHLKNKALNMYNIKEFDSKRVPNKLKEYAKKCIKANETYIDGTEAIRLGQYNKYYDNFLEVDARFAEESITKLFGLMTK